MDYVFELKNVSYAYLDKFPAVSDVSLTIRKGDQVALMGANGSGKSTLLAILDALVYPTGGEFLAFGNPVTEEAFDTISGNEFSRYFRRHVGFVFQNSDAQLFSSSVYDEIAFGPLQLDMKPDDVRARVEEVMDMIGIAQLRDRAPHTLSGGEKKKVAIACVLALNPEVLILDEPMNGLDPRTERWLVAFLRELNDAGKTLLVSTHNLELVQEISRRAVLFGEDHAIAADLRTPQLMDDIDLLKRVNLVDEFYHRHADGGHRHYHSHNY
jgi:cobalt/nickel transport system ATP-binding protein